MVILVYFIKFFINIINKQKIFDTPFTFFAIGVMLTVEQNNSGRKGQITGGERNNDNQRGI